MSALPLPRDFFHPVLQFLAEHSLGLHRSEIYERVADRVGLTPDQRALRLPSRPVLKYRHRMGWSLNMLNAGVVPNPQRGVRAITPAGLAFLSEHPKGLSREDQLELVRRANTAPGTRAADGPLGRPTPKISEYLVTTREPLLKIDDPLARYVKGTEPSTILVTVKKNLDDADTAGGHARAAPCGHAEGLRAQGPRAPADREHGEVPQGHPPPRPPGRRRREEEGEGAEEGGGGESTETDTECRPRVARREPPRPR